MNGCKLFFFVFLNDEMDPFSDVFFCSMTVRLITFLKDSENGKLLNYFFANEKLKKKTKNLFQDLTRYLCHRPN